MSITEKCLAELAAEPLTISQLALRTGYHKSTVSREVASLRAKNLVVVEDQPDRSRLVRLPTPTEVSLGGLDQSIANVRSEIEAMKMPVGLEWIGDAAADHQATLANLNDI